MRQVREALAGPERKLWREIEAFEASRPSVASGYLKVATAPFQAMVPARVTDGMRDALGGLVGVVQKASEWDVNPELVLQGSDFKDLQAVRDRATVEQLKALTDGHANPAILKATIQGAGLGLGGVMLAIADVPLLLLAHLKLLARLAMACGYDLRDPGEHRFLLALLKLGYCLGDWEERRSAVDELEGLILEEFRPGDRDDEIARAVLFRSVGAFSDKIGPILLRRRFGSVMPFLGSVIGAGANYMLTADVAAAGRHTMWKRLLVERTRQG